MSVLSKIGKTGRITSGENSGYFIRIEDDTTGSTGGYYVLGWKDGSGADGFDYWFEKKEELDPFFEHSEWMVEWLDLTE